METIYGEGEDTKDIDVSYLNVNALFPYNIILGFQVINALGAVISTRYLILKYSLPGGKVGAIKGDE